MTRLGFKTTGMISLYEIINILEFGAINSKNVNK